MSCRFRAALLSGLLHFASSAAAAPCLQPVPACIEWVSVGGDAARARVYRNHPLDARNSAVTHALIVVHGLGRNADNYYRYALAGGSLAGALDHTLVIAPRFSSNQGRTCRDTLAQDELNWVCAGAASWRSGGAAVGHSEVTSFDLLDELLRRLARREVFPNLEAVVLAGHSAGGQYVTRYGLANRLHEKLPFRLSYVVSNPSSYTYPDSQRPAAAEPPACSGYNAWPYGLEKRVGYTANLGDDELRRNLASRPVTYLLGELDIYPLSNFDGSCPAMAQGATRLARGLAYARHVRETLGARHQVVLVPGCGHNARCMFGAEAALPVLFGRD